jgi:hypothetical protein
MPTTDPLLEHVADALATDRLSVAITEMAARHPERAAVITGAGSAARRVIDYAALGASLTTLETRLDAVRPAGVFTTAERAESPPPAADSVCPSPFCRGIPATSPPRSWTGSRSTIR